MGAFEYPATGIVLPDRDSWTSTDMVDFAVETENAGYDSVWGYNPFTVLGRISEWTDCALGTAIVNAYARPLSQTPAEPVPLSNATLGDANRRLTVEHADGIIPNLHHRTDPRGGRRCRRRTHRDSRLTSGSDSRRQ